jgi:hypothetical protein
LQSLAAAAGTTAAAIKSDPFKYLAPWLTGRSRRDSGRWTPGPSETTVRVYHEELLTSPEQLRYLLGVRGIHPGHVQEYELGYDRPGHAITFPVRDAAGELVNLKRRFLDPAADPKSSGMAGEGRSHIYPIDRLHGEGRLVLCEGETTALVLNRHGIRAVTSTASTSWKPEWTEQLTGQRVALLFDVDAEEISRRRADTFRAAGIDAWPVLLSAAGFTGKTDADDVLMKHGWTGDLLRQFITSSRRSHRRGRAA